MSQLKLRLSKKLQHYQCADCTICMCSLSDKDEYLKKLSCGHCFHIGCIKEWFNTNTSCPICRDQSPDSLIKYNPNKLGDSEEIIRRRKFMEKYPAVDGFRWLAPIYARWEFDEQFKLQIEVTALESWINK